MDKVTVIIPVYNGEKFLEETLNSLLNQTYKDFKVLIFNDNSNDSTLEIITKYKEQDSRVEIISKTVNQGPANLRNEGIDKATTEYVALLDADDIAMPQRFEKQIKVLDSNPNLALCGSWFTIFGDKKEKIIKHSVKYDDLKIQFLHSCGIGNSTVMFRKAMLGNLRFEHQYVPAEDYSLWSDFIAKHEFYNIPESLVRYRWHSGNISQTKEENLRIAEVLIKKKQLAHLEITPNDQNSIYYVNAVCLKRKQSFEEIKKTIIASEKLLVQNKKIGFYDQNLFEKHINKTIVRTIRNSKKYDLSYFKYIKKDSGYYSKIKFIDKVNLFFKCLI